MALSPGDSLGPYEIVAPLGAGGMGEVYRARDGRAARDVAVKVLPADVRGDAERLRRFALEARAASTLDHPNIVAVLDFDMKAATPFIVTELLDGMTLREHLESSSRDAGGMAIDEAISIARQLASGLASAHANGIVHRDIKPENLFLCADGRLAILDFGLGRATVPTSGGGAPSRGLTIGLDEDTGTGAVVGTISYMAPEQLTGRSVDHRADLFAFGLVLHELLTGRRTFVGDTPVERAYAILNDPPPPLPSTVPRALRALVERCLAKAADARPASADEVLAVLDGLGRALSEGTPPTPVPRAAPPEHAQALHVAASKVPGARDLAATRSARPPPPALAEPPERAVARPSLPATGLHHWAIELPDPPVVAAPIAPVVPAQLEPRGSRARGVVIGLVIAAAIAAAGLALSSLGVLK